MMSGTRAPNSKQVFFVHRPVSVGSVRRSTLGQSVAISAPSGQKENLIVQADVGHIHGRVERRRQLDGAEVTNGRCGRSNPTPMKKGRSALAARSMVPIAPVAVWWSTN